MLAAFARRAPTASIPAAASASPPAAVRAESPSQLRQHVPLRYLTASACVFGAYLQANAAVLDFHGSLTTLSLLLLAGILAHEIALAFLGAAALIGGFWALLSGGAFLPAAMAVALGFAMMFGPRPAWGNRAARNPGAAPPQPDSLP